MRENWKYIFLSKRNFLYLAEIKEAEDWESIYCFQVVWLLPNEKVKYREKHIFPMSLLSDDSNNLTSLTILELCLKTTLKIERKDISISLFLLV